MAEQTNISHQLPKRCTGDCKNCSLYQHAYCSSQMAFNTQNLLAGVSDSVGVLAKRIGELTAKIDAITGCGDDLLTPVSNSTDETT